MQYLLKNTFKNKITLSNHSKGQHKVHPESSKCKICFLGKSELNIHKESCHKKTLEREPSLRSKPSKSQKK